MNKKVLVVDDEKEVTMSLDGFFSALGYDMLSAFDGKKALEIVASNRLDLILLDIRMPGVDGTEVLKKVKKENPEVKVIVFTAFGSDYKEKVEKLGADHFFTKPLDLPKLIDAIQELLEPETAKAYAVDEKKQAVSTTQTTKAKILFIQPNPMTYGFTCGFFAGHDHLAGGDYETKVCFDAKEALKFLYDYSPDVVIMYDSFFNPEDAKEFGGLIMRSSHKPKAVILHSLIPRTQLEVIELEKAGIRFCNQNVMTDENLRATNKKLVDFVQQECVKYGLVKKTG